MSGHQGTSFANNGFGKRNGNFRARILSPAMPLRQRPNFPDSAGTEYLLRHQIHKRSHDLDSVSKPTWLHLQFPWMWQTDILEILGILTRLGVRDPRMREAADVLLSKQDGQGRWTLERTFNGRFQTGLERKGKPSKWITAHALSAIKRFYR
jgi:hypothetical protein